MSTSHPAPDHGKRIAGYEVISKLGQGGMGAVYKARQISLDRVVALKVLPKQLTDKTDFISRFSREARMTGQLNHPNIIKVYDVGRSTTGICYYAMEFVEGESLRNIVEREGKLAPPRVLRLIEEVTRALEHAQKHGIIHRDIKPDNILIDTHGNVKLADLGLAKDVDSTGSMAGASLSGTVIGTPHYMSPEQAEGKTVDTRSDLYSLGATAFHLLSGSPPFSAETPIGVITKHLTEAPPPIQERAPGIPQGFARAVHRLLQKDPSKRFQTPSELLTELSRLHLEKPSAPEARAREKAGAASSPPWFLILFCILAAAGVTAGVLHTRKSPPESPPSIPPPEPPEAKPPAQPAAGDPAKRDLTDVDRYAAQNPADLQGILLRLRELETRYPGTKIAGEAGLRIGNITEVMKVRDARRKQAEDEFETRIRRLIRERNWSQAENQIRAAPQSLAELATLLNAALQEARRGDEALQPPPVLRLTPELKEAESLLALPAPSDTDMARLKEILSKPPPSLELAARQNKLYENFQKLCLRREMEILEADAACRAWKRVQTRIPAIHSVHASVQDDGQKARLARLADEARHALSQGAWHEDFEEGALDPEWKTAKPMWGRPVAGELSLLENDKASPQERAQGRFAMRMGSAAAGDGRSSVEIQSPLLDLRPGARLRVKAASLLRTAPGIRPPSSKTPEALYFCLRNARGDILPFGGNDRVPQFIRKAGFLLGRNVAGAWCWGTPAPLSDTMLLDMDLDVRTPVEARLCIGISVEEVSGRSATLIVDDIDLSYPSPSPP